MPGSLDEDLGRVEEDNLVRSGQRSCEYRVSFVSGSGTKSSSRCDSGSDVGVNTSVGDAEAFVASLSLSPIDAQSRMRSVGNRKLHRRINSRPHEKALVISMADRGDGIKGVY